MPIAKVLKRDSVVSRFMLQARQNDERQQNVLESKTDRRRMDLHFEVVWSKDWQDNVMAGAAQGERRTIPIRRIDVSDRTC